MHARIVRHTKTPWSPPRNARREGRQPLRFAYGLLQFAAYQGLGEGLRVAGRTGLRRRRPADRATHNRARDEAPPNARASNAVSGNPSVNEGMAMTSAAAKTGRASSR